MSVPVVTALPGTPWEADLVAALDGTLGVRVVRRCVDLPDLLAAAAGGTARAAILSAELRRLDRDALARLAGSGLAVVGLVLPGDDAGERRLRQLGVGQVLAADAGPERVSAAVIEAVGSPTPGLALGYADPRRALPDLGQPAEEPPFATASSAATGRLVAVWGPTGAPGRTFVAVNLAAELARLQVPTLLVDADTYGGAVAQVLGLLDESPGLAAAARQAGAGSLDRVALARQARQVGTFLRVLTGISRPDRWVELRPAALESVWSQARQLAALTVVDCGFSLEQDEELLFDTAAPRRNAATLVTLAEADVVVAVGAADPVGLGRLVRGLADLRELVPGASIRVVLNRVRRGPVGPDPERALTEAMTRYAGVSDPVLVPDDRAGADAALARGRTLADVAPESPVRPVLATLAASVAGQEAPVTRRGRFVRRARRPGRATRA